jgi:hypothetical protein
MVAGLMDISFSLTAGETAKGGQELAAFIPEEGPDEAEAIRSSV